MMAALLNLLFMPVCAALSGLFLWATAGQEPKDDRELYRGFIWPLAAFMLLYWGTVNTDAVRMYTDPVFRMQAEMDAHPVYAALKLTAPDDHKALHEFLEGQMSQGLALPEAFVQARPLLTRLANERMGFADQKTRIQWGQVTVDTLRELQSRDPELCYRVMSSQSLDPQTLASAFSVGNANAFQQAGVSVYESADKGMRHERTPGDQPADFNEAARAFSAIRDDLAQQFGQPVSRQVSSKKLPEQPSEPAEQLCAARIAQLDAMLARPQGMAAMLVDSILR